MKIYLDFDGTVVEHQYPRMGRCNFGCIEVIKKLQDAGHEVVLNTYRANISPSALQQALDFLNVNAWAFLNGKQDHFFELKPIVALPEKLHPAQWDWNLMNQTDAVYIDDVALHMPLKPAVMSEGKMVDWGQINLEFIENGMY